MLPFTYHRATSLADARAAYDAAVADGREPTYLAGGQTLIPTLKMRLAQHGMVIDLGRIGGLGGVERTAGGGGLSIGGLVTHGALAASPVVTEALPALAALAASIGDPAVRSMGTVGGALANNDPAADYPAAALALDATIHTDARAIPAADFFGAYFETALEPGEIVRALTIPALPLAAGYAKVRNPASRYAVVGVFVARTTAGPRVAVTGAAGQVFRHAALEAALAANFSPAATQGVATDPDGLNDDLHASAAYRAHLCSVLAGRAVAAALAG